ncbi:MAG: tetratricopeptide repeat protein [Proteobacteria bacterium]|nr:tetratricopeptide repeat protein [Pseudomonadota bacterium]
MMNFFKSFAVAAILCLASTSAFAQDGAPNPEKLALVEAYNASQWDVSIEKARAILASTPDDPVILNILAVSLAHTGNNDEAVKTFLKVKELTPEEPQVYANLCQLQSSLGSEDALDSCVEAANRIHNNADIFYKAGIQLDKKQKTSEARAMYEKAWNLDQKDLRYLTAITSIDSANDDDKSALELTEAAIRNGHSVAILYLNAALSAYRIGNYPKCLELAEEGYQKFHDPLMLISKAEALNGLHRFDEAIEIWAQLEKDTDEGGIGRDRIEYGYATALLAISCNTKELLTCSSQTPASCCGRDELALKFLKSAQKSEKHALRREKMLKTQYGMALVLNGQFEEAEAVLTKASTQDLNADNATALAALAVTLYMFNDPRDREAGLLYYRQAVEASPDFADIDKVKQTRVWPPMMLDTLATIQADASAQDLAQKTKKSGCSCQLAETPAVPLSAILLTFLMFAVLIFSRRKPE